MNQITLTKVTPKLPPLLWAAIFLFNSHPNLMLSKSIKMHNNRDSEKTLKRPSLKNSDNKLMGNSRQEDDSKVNIGEWEGWSQ
jgi:hypothetical protein